MKHGHMMATALMVLAGTMGSTAQTTGTFDSNDEGWTSYNDGTLSWDGTNGNPPGCLKMVDRNSGSYFGFQAPPAYFGDHSTDYGGTFEFEMKSTGTTDSGPSNPDVVIVGNGVTLVLDLPRPSNTVFSHRSIKLDTSAGWRITTLTGTVAAESDIRNALSNVTQIRIRGEFTSSSDTAYLDNVKLLTPGYVVPPSIATVRLGRLSSGTVSSLANVDEKSMSVCKFIVPNQLVPPISVELDAILPFDPGDSFGFIAVTRMNTTGSFVQSLELWDWQSVRWDPADVSAQPITGTYSVQSIVATPPYTRYVDMGNVRARYQVKATGPVAVALWCHEADHMAWLVQPGS